MTFWNQAQFANSEFGPFFRFLDDFAEQSSSRAKDAPNVSCAGPSPTQFRPKFDVVETGSGYELFGDLPGVAQQDVAVEFPDVQTLTIRGKVVRRQPKAAEPAAEPTSTSPVDDDASSTKDKHASVEDGNDDDEFMEVDKQGEQQSVAAKSVAKNATPEAKAPEFKFHVLERKLGQFSRTFSFPNPVDTEAVTASLRDGVLHVIVPKSAKAGVKKVVIQ